MDILKKEAMNNGIYTRGGGGNFPRNVSISPLSGVDKEEVLAQIDGIVRGMLQENIEVFKGMKAGDIDPRCEKDHCFTISDKARSIGGGVLEAIMYMSNKNK